MGASMAFLPDSPSLGIVGRRMAWLKRTAQSALLSLGSGLVLLLADPAGVVAQTAEKVVLLEDPAAPPRPGLSAALRIQLVGAALVEAHDAPVATGLARRVRAASELADAEGALLVVWAEPTLALPDGSHEVVLYVVGHDQGRALVEVVRVQGGDSPDVDRSLALKVREVVDEVRRNRALAAGSGLMLTPAEPARGGHGPTLGLGLALGPLSGLAQWGARVHGGIAVVDGPLRFSGLLALSWHPEVDAQGDGARVSVAEVAPGLLARVGFRTRAVWLGLRAGAALSFIEAQAVSARGSGEASVRVVSFVTGLEIEVPIADGIGLVAAVELQTRARRQRFAVLGDAFVDLGRVRPLALLAVTWSGLPP